MSDNVSKDQVLHYINQLNSTFNIALNPEDFKNSSYSISSIKDIFIQKIIDELSGEWTSDMAFHKIKKATIEITGAKYESITQDTLLDELFPAADRKDKIKSLSEKLGAPLDVLKPNSAIYGTLIFLFFACIPFAIGMDWFVSGIAMVVIAILIYILGKTGNQFKMKTIGQMADVVAWKNYLVQKKNENIMSESEIRSKVDSIIK
jgi:hypothetical protein